MPIPEWEGFVPGCGTTDGGSVRYRIDAVPEESVEPIDLGAEAALAALRVAPGDVVLLSFDAAATSAEVERMVSEARRVCGSAGIDAPLLAFPRSFAVSPVPLREVASAVEDALATAERMAHGGMERALLDAAARLWTAETLDDARAETRAEGSVSYAALTVPGQGGAPDFQVTAAGATTERAAARLVVRVMEALNLRDASRPAAASDAAATGEVEDEAHTLPVANRVLGRDAARRTWTLACACRPGCPGRGEVTDVALANLHGGPWTSPTDGAGRPYLPLLHHGRAVASGRSIGMAEVVGAVGATHAIACILEST